MGHVSTTSQELEEARSEMTRRRILGLLATSTAIVAGSALHVPDPSHAAASTPQDTSPANPAAALARLRQGNKRYTSGTSSHPNQDALRRVAIAQAQRPFAAILSCADSRLPPEIVFDQGLGDLFDIRVAGNIVDPAILGSLEYGVEHLGVRVVVVLGHQRCGAVSAAVALATDGTDPGAHISAFVKPILPAVKAAQAMPGDLVENTVRANVRLVAAQLRASGPILSEASRKGELVVAGARYDLNSGVVTFDL